VTVTVEILEDGTKVFRLGDSYLEVALLATAYWLRRNGRA
jgi:hypothetical protein